MEPQVAENAAEVATDPNFINSFARFFVEGGFFMWPILLIAAWGIGVAILRGYRVLMFDIDAESFFSKIQKFVLDNAVDRAINLCNGKTGSLLPTVLKSGLLRAQGNEQEIQNSVDEATMHTIPLLEKYSLYLPLISNMATLFGLLGTINGLITAFAAIGNVAPDEKAAYLAAAIAEAMNATKFGLMVAIPAMFMNAIIQSRANKIAGDLDHYSIRIVNLLTQSKHK